MQKWLWAFIFLGLTLPAQDIWHDQGEVFTDKHLLPRGSVIHIIFDENLLISYQSKINKKISKNEKSDDVSAEAFDFLPSFRVSATGSENTESTFDRQNTITGKIAGKITDVDPENGLYSFSASHIMRVGTKSETVILSGSFSQKDLHNRQIKSTAIADIRLSYLGVKITKAKKAKEADFKNLSLEPGPATATSNTGGTRTRTTGPAAKPRIELTPAKKKELYLEYFNIILNELF